MSSPSMLSSEEGGMVPRGTWVCPLLAVFFAFPSALDPLGSLSEIRLIVS